MKYLCLKQQEFQWGNYSIRPIRFQDKYDIMDWRNKQINILRQEFPLTPQQQDNYFQETILPLFSKEHPEQILFSFFKEENLVGYGGLVHINWKDSNAEISFLTKDAEQLNLWVPYLELLSQVAFKELKLTKIYTYSYNLRPRLYEFLKQADFVQEAVFSNQVADRLNNTSLDVKIHAKYNTELFFWRRMAVLEDAEQLFLWRNDETVRNQSFDEKPISWETHLNWYFNKLLQSNCQQYIYFSKQQPIGMGRLDYYNDAVKINYSVDEKHRGRGYGNSIIENLKFNTTAKIIAEVKLNNIASNRIFEKCEFEIIQQDSYKKTWMYEVKSQ